MNRPRVAFFVLLLGAAGLPSACQPSEVEDPAAKVTITGRLLDAGGAGVPSHKVELSYPLERVILADAEMESVEDETDGSGSYRFELRGRDLNYRGGNEARDFTLRATGPEGPEGTAGTTVSGTFEVNRLQFPLDLKFWDARAQLMPDGLISWEVVPPDLGTGTGYELTIYSLLPGQNPNGSPRRHHIGSYEPRGASQRLDPRFLEDISGTFEIEAQRAREAPGSNVRLTYRYGPVNYTGAAGAPPSRGKSCYIDDSLPEKQVPIPCPLTDGDFSHSDPRLLDRPTVIDLGSAVPVELVVVRGCNCPVETSLDATTWASLGKTKEGVAVPESPRTARFVKVMAQFNATEVSVW